MWIEYDAFVSIYEYPVPFKEENTNEHLACAICSGRVLIGFIGKPPWKGENYKFYDRQDCLNKLKGNK